MSLLVTVAKERKNRHSAKQEVEVIIKKVMFSVIITTGLGGIMAYFAHQTIKESPNS